MIDLSYLNNQIIPVIAKVLKPAGHKSTPTGGNVQRKPTQNLGIIIFHTFAGYSFQLFLETNSKF